MARKDLRDMEIRRSSSEPVERRISQTFKGLPWGVYAALTPLVKGDNQDAVVKRFLAAWEKSPYAHSPDAHNWTREKAEKKLIDYAKLWASMQAGPADGETQHA